MVKIIGAATSNEQAASAITDLRNRNLIEEGVVLYHRKDHSLSDNFLDSTMIGATLSSFPDILTGGSMANIPQDKITSESSDDSEVNHKRELLLNSGITADGINRIDHWLNEGKYVVFIKCKQEIPRIVELLEGLHGIDNVMEV